MDVLLDLDVDGAGGVVQHEDAGVRQQAAGKGDALALAARERVAALADHLVVPSSQLTDESVGLSGAGCPHDVVQRGVRPAEGDVVPDRLGEQERLVGDLVGVMAQARQREVAHVVAVDQDGACVHVVEAAQQAGDGRLAAAGSADDGDDLAGLHDQVEAVQHRRCVGIGAGIGEAHAAELDPAGRVQQVPGAGSLGDCRHLVEDLEDAPRRGGRPLCLEQHEAQHPERDGDHDHVAAECQQGADADALLDRQPAAVEQDRRHPEAREGLDQGVEAGPGVDEGCGRPAQPLGRPGQEGDLLGFGGE